MTCRVEGSSFACSRGSHSGPCAGTGRAVVVKPPATVYGTERRECPVCGRVNQPTYETEDGRSILLAH